MWLTVALPGGPTDSQQEHPLTGKLETRRTHCTAKGGLSAGTFSSSDVLSTKLRKIPPEATNCSPSGPRALYFLILSRLEAPVVSANPRTDPLAIGSTDGASGV